MTLKDAVKDRDWNRIEYRIEFPEELGSGDTYYGECRYIGGKLMPLDEDTYSLDDEITHYTVAEAAGDISEGLKTLIVYVTWNSDRIRR